MAFYKRQSVLSLEFVQAELRAEKDGDTYDPTGDRVWMAFTLNAGAPQPADWRSGQWETETAGPLTTYLASVLVGPGGIAVLAVGRYTVWLKVGDAPEVPIIPCGVLDVY